MPRSATDFNLGNNIKAERKLLVTCIDVSEEGAEAPVWQVVGAGVEDSSIEFNPETETITDILGITETTVSKLELAQELDPMTVRGGSKLAFKLHDIYFKGELAKFANFKVMIIYAYLGTAEDGYYAEIHSGCTVTPQSLGGSGNVDMPISISLSNNKVLGTVNDYKLNAEITFTPEV